MRLCVVPLINGGSCVPPEQNFALACRRHAVQFQGVCTSLTYTSPHIAWQVLRWLCWFYAKGKPTWKPGEFPQPFCILLSLIKKKNHKSFSRTSGLAYHVPILLLKPFFFSLSQRVKIFPALAPSWGLWQKRDMFFFSFHVLLCCFAQGFSLPSLRLGVCVWTPWDCLCVCMLNPDRAVWLRRLVTTAPTHPRRGIFCPSPPPKPPYLFLRVCYCSILFTTTPPLIFFSSRSGRNTGQGWEGCPVPTLGGSHTPREKHARASKHTLKHMRSVSFHCWICIWAWVVH